MNFNVTYAEILERVNALDPVKYARTRNYLDGNVTYLSPFISRGVISTKQVLESVLARGYKRYQIEKFVQELAWREYFQRVWQNKMDLIYSDLKQPQPDVLHHEMINGVQEANTGLNVIDQMIAQLYKSGYMHNHMRMYVASITCNIGKAHWKHPADWLYYHLLDGDIASNYCSWQWVAGAFSSKKYYCNQENINKYTGSCQQGTFLDRGYEDIVEMDPPSALVQTSMLALFTSLPKPNPPNIDPHLPTLIYNSYNLDPIWRNYIDANRILLLEPSHFSRFPVSDNVMEFILQMANNISGIQVYVGEFEDFVKSYPLNPDASVIFKEHPAFRHYIGTMEQRDWMFPSVTGYHPSFFSFWKKCEKAIA